MKGEAQVFSQPGKTFDPALIPKAISNAGFSAPEILVEADGTLMEKTGGLLLTVPGRSQPFLLTGGAKAGALAKRGDLLGKKIRVTGKLRGISPSLPSELTIEDFQPLGN